MPENSSLGCIRVIVSADDCAVLCFVEALVDGSLRRLALNQDPNLTSTKSIFDDGDVVLFNEVFGDDIANNLKPNLVSFIVGSAFVDEERGERTNDDDRDGELITDAVTLQNLGDGKLCHDFNLDFLIDVVGISTVAEGFRQLRPSRQSLIGLPIQAKLLYLVLKFINDTMDELSYNAYYDHILLKLLPEPT